MKSYVSFPKICDSSSNPKARQPGNTSRALGMFNPVGGLLGSNTSSSNSSTRVAPERKRPATRKRNLSFVPGTGPSTSPSRKRKSFSSSGSLPRAPAIADV